MPMTTCDEPEFHYRFGIGLFIDGVKAAALRISGAGYSGYTYRMNPVKRATLS